MHLSMRKTHLGSSGGLYPASVVGYGAEGWSSGGGVGGLFGLVLPRECVLVVFREPHRLTDFRHSVGWLSSIAASWFWDSDSFDFRWFFFLTIQFNVGCVNRCVDFFLLELDFFLRVGTFSWKSFRNLELTTANFYEIVDAQRRWCTHISIKLEETSDSSGAAKQRPWWISRGKNVVNT